MPRAIFNGVIPIGDGHRVSPASLNRGSSEKGRRTAVPGAGWIEEAAASLR